MNISCGIIQKPSRTLTVRSESSVCAFSDRSRPSWRSGRNLAQDLHGIFLWQQVKDPPHSWYSTLHGTQDHGFLQSRHRQQFSAHPKSPKSWHYETTWDEQWIVCATFTKRSIGSNNIVFAGFTEKLSKVPVLQQDLFLEDKHLEVPGWRESWSPGWSGKGTIWNSREGLSCHLVPTNTRGSLWTGWTDWKNACT